MRGVLVILCLLILCSCSVSSQSFNESSKSISYCQLSKGIRKGKADQFHEVRLKLNALNKLSFADTSKVFYVLESYDIESGTIYGLVWNQENKLSYSYYNGNFSFEDVQRFTEYMAKLVENWDIETINQEEKEHATMTPNPIIYASRITKENGAIKADCIAFKEFFKLSRDRE